MKYQINHFDIFEREFKFSRDTFCLAGTAFLSVLGIRANGDLDVILLRETRRKAFSKDGTVHFPSKEFKKISFYPLYDELKICSKKFSTSDLIGFYIRESGVQNEDDLILNRTIIIDNIRFLEPRLIILMKKKRNKRKDKKDIILYKNWIIKNKLTCGIDYYKLGVDLL